MHDRPCCRRWWENRNILCVSSFEPGRALKLRKAHHERRVWPSFAWFRFCVSRARFAFLPPRRAWPLSVCKLNRSLFKLENGVLSGEFKGIMFIESLNTWPQHHQHTETHKTITKWTTPKWIHTDYMRSSFLSMLSALWALCPLWRFSCGVSVPKTHFPHIFTTHKQPTDRPLCLIIRGWIHHLANREILNNLRLSCICSLLPGLMNCVVCIQVQCVRVNLPSQHLSFACALCN